MIDWSSIPVRIGDIKECDTIVRQSTIGQLQLCGFRVALEDEEGYLPAVSEQLVFGTGLHHLIAQDLLVGEPRMDMLLNMDEWLGQILVEDYSWSLEQVPNVRDFFSELAAAYRSWRTEVFPQLEELVSVEQEMYLYLGEGKEGKIWLRGTPDVVFAPRLADWKTSAKPWSQAKADLSIQASLYPALVKQHHGKSIRNFRFWNYVRPKHEWIRLDTARSIGQIDSALGTALAYGRQIEAATFVPTPVPDAAFQKQRGWYCSPKFCGAWNICPAKYLADSKDESEVAVRSW